MAIRPIMFSAPMVRALLEDRKTQTRRVLRGAWQQSLNGHDKVKTFFAPADVPQGGIPNVWAPSGIWAEKHGPSGYNRHLGFSPFRPGDLLYVREAFGLAFEYDENDKPVGEEKLYYRADGEPFNRYYDPERDRWLDELPWKPSIHMPRWASRLTLAVTDVRVQRLNEISEEDSICEGILRGDPLPQIPSSKGTIGHSGVEATLDDGFAWTRQPKMAFLDLWQSIHGPGSWEQNPWVVAVSFTVHKANVDQLKGAEG